MSLSVTYLRSLPAEELDALYEMYLRHVRHWIDEEEHLQSEQKFGTNLVKSALKSLKVAQEFVEKNKGDIELNAYCFKNDSETLRNIKTVRMESLQ